MVDLPQPGDGRLPAQPQSGARDPRIFGGLLIPASLLMAYFWIVRPLIDAQHTGELHYLVKGILLPPVLLYLGVALLFVDLRDGQISHLDERGRKVFTRKGRMFLFGLVLTIVLFLAAWAVTLHTLGFEVF